MNPLQQQVEQREQGQFPFSIPTSLAFEGAFGIYPEKETHVEHIRDYDTIWINVSTLFRNFFNALPREIQDSVTPDVVVESFNSEIDAIEGFLDTRIDRFSIYYYYPTHESIRSYFPNASYRHATTPRQKQYQSIEEQTIRYLLRNVDRSRIQNFDVRIRGSGNALILTHNTVDLLSRRYFGEMTLLESHTGRIRPWHEWGGKLHIRDETLPFNQYTLQLFGDNHNFSPKPMKYRRAFLDMAKKERWSPKTKERRFRYAINSLKDEDTQTELKRLFEYRSI